jgi:hypothetical protein
MAKKVVAITADQFARFMALPTGQIPSGQHEFYSVRDGAYLGVLDLVRDAEHGFSYVITAADGSGAMRPLRMVADIDTEEEARERLRLDLERLAAGGTPVPSGPFS